MLTRREKIIIALYVLSIFLITCVRPAHAEEKILITPHQAQIIKQFIAGQDRKIKHLEAQLNEAQQKYFAAQDCVADAVRNKTLVMLCFDHKKR